MYIIFLEVQSFIIHVVLTFYYHGTEHVIISCLKLRWISEPIAGMIRNRNVAK